MTDFNSNVLGPVTPLPSWAAYPPRITVETEWQLDPTATSGTEKWERVTQLVREIKIKRGRNSQLDRVETGTMSVRLDNSDRRFETGYVGSLLNYVENPSVEGGHDGWTALGGTDTLDIQGAAYKGHYHMAIWRRDPTLENVQIGDGLRIVNNSGGRITVTPSLPWTFSIFVVRQDLSMPDFKLQILEYNSGGTLIATTDSAAFTPGILYTRHQLTVTTAATTATVALQIVMVEAGTGALGSGVWIDAAQLEAGSTATTYVDGDQDNCHWEGTAHASRSFRGAPYYPNVRPMRRIRVVATQGNPIEDSSFSTSPVPFTADDPLDATKVWYAQNAVGITRITTPTPPQGTYAYRGEKQATGNHPFMIHGSRFLIPVNPGDVVQASAYLRKPSSGANPQCLLGFMTYDRNRAQQIGYNGASIDPSDSAWVRYYGTPVVIPTGIYFISPRPTIVGTVPVTGTAAYMDGFQLDIGPVTPYSDGQGPQTIFRGFIQRFPQHSPSYLRGEVTLDAVDAMAVLAADNYTGTVPPSEGSKARLDRFLDEALWPSALRKLDTGTATLGAEASVPINQLSHALDIALTELGVFFVDGPGFAVLHDKNHRTTNTRSTVSQATFGDGAGELPFLPSILPDQDVQKVANKITATSRAAVPVAQVVSDATSKNRYWERERSFQTLHSTDAAALTWANAVLLKLKEPPLEIDRLEVEPARDPRLAAVALYLEISDRVTVNRRAQGLELRTFVLFVESVEHRFVLDGRKIEWRVGWNLSSAT